MGRALAVALVGLNGHVIEVEADIGQTLPSFVLLGLPDAALSEARERIRSAAQNSGIPLSRRKITVNLVPASLPKKGSGFDLSKVYDRHTMKSNGRAAGIYVRISHDHEGAGLGVARQEEDCRTLAARLGWTVAAVYVDNDISAYQRRRVRKGYKALLADVEAGTIDAILAWHTDRLHRRTAELEGFIDVIEPRGVEVQTVQGGPLDLATSQGRMVARMGGVLAQHEIEHMRERMIRAKAQAADMGKWRGGPRPFGYEPDGVTPRAAEAAALVRAADKFIAGQSLRSVARDMAADGITTSSAGAHPMDEIALRRILLRPRNAGWMENRGEITGPANWPGILPEETWRAVTAKLKDPARTTTTGNTGRWLGSGLYLCAVCGGTVRAAAATGGRRVYRCKSGAHVTRDQAQTDKLVRGVIAGLLRRPETLARFTTARPDTVAPLRAEAAALRTRRDLLAVDYANGDLTGAQVRIATANLDGKIRDVEARLGAVGMAASMAGLASAPDPAQVFLDAAVGRQRAVLAALAVVTIHPQAKGRTKGWRGGEPYFDTESVTVELREG
ncbi:recombinase family protein [Arthrobacter wenxiniae]|uniref:Recombinase family protein n=1 Tax=Arthrobacter wenxiniae TaxID=2713570 RepID=A0A7Y7LZK5_9MICC|nr:recombinase family protein [Arthrobacter wenxiniae]NVM94766.1 recombinase family protein [Arthrobacter wenxiniae]